MSSINISRCKSCIAVASKIFPQGHRLYDFTLKSLLREPRVMINDLAPVPGSFQIPATN